MLYIYVYFFLMLNLFFVVFFYSLLMYMMDFSIVMEWMVMSINSYNYEVFILMDWISLMFISFILLISSMIIMYSYIYMGEEVFIERFIFLVLLFILSMILMIISPNLISILFGWDGLGLVSYCLVIFYQNYMSYNSGMVTVLCNRVGDIGILMSIGLMLMNGSWNMVMLSGLNMKLIMFMVLIAAITKSAQIPFSTWLPMAMAAPTPVSALVHSSTLVTAGVYLIIRFNKFFMESNLNYLLLFLSVFTMFMSGFMANVEFDLKKIIALSTLSQLGLMMMILSLGFELVAFYHLLMHAIFKSMLFMCAGIIIHSMMNCQDIRLLGNLKEYIPFTMMCFFISSLALCGFPFMAGFYSKDLIMELIYSVKVNFFMLVFIMISLMFTVSYSVRLCYYVFFCNLKFYSYYNFKEDTLMNLCMLILMFLSVILGSVMNWMVFFDFYLNFLSLSVKVITLETCLMGVVLGWCFNLVILIKYYYFSYYLSSMWFLNYVYLWVYNPVNFGGYLVYEIDKSWIEFSSKNFIVSMFLSYINYMVKSKIYMYINIMICLGFLLFIIM